MNRGKQATLFQTWGAKKSNPVCNSNRKHSDNGINPGTSTNDVIDLCDGLEDEDEELLAQAAETLDVSGESTTGNLRNPGGGLPSAGPSTEEDVCNISLGAETFSGTLSLTQIPAPEGFDKAAGKLWIYPTNYPVRDYQFNICQQSLYKNTMVTLPTGLGKTFIASVVMYNFYRWYPQGKVVFMAPTKPLVAQQIEACYNIMGIPQLDTAEMTGNMPPTERRRSWHEKRVFFLTPQVLTNDLSRGTCPAEQVRCLVVDEAHKALGNHAYCQVVRELIKYTQNFRILALSATPGSDIKAVQQVLSNLLISHIELRTEESIDIKQYSHERKVEKVVIPLGDELSLIKKKYVQVLDVVVNKLKRQGVLYKRDTTSFSKFLILKAREAFRQNPPPQMQRSQYGVVEGDFALAMSLYHGLELLQLHGQRSLYNYLEGIMSGDKGYGRTRSELSKNADFTEMMDTLRKRFSPDPNIRSSQKDKQVFMSGHPKMDRLEEVVIKHFNTFNKDGTDDEKSKATRVMIFSQYRDSVSEITDMLKRHGPMVKVMSFIGQSSAGKATKGFTQKEQLKVMKEFREGGYNTLVSTCVGEEGLDIGEVDLIVCFDAHKSPIRLVQRMGRTGRKREGRIIMLVTEGKEEQIYNQSQYSKKSIHKAILNGARSLHFYQNNPRMVPEGWTPPCHKMHISVKQDFKPKKNPKAVKDSRQSKIGFKTRVNKEVAVDDGLLTAEEYQDIMQNYSVPDDFVFAVPSRKPWLCFGDKQENLPSGNRKCLLREWLPWQNRLQQTYNIDHSTKSKNFVELMEFIEMQETPDRNQDPYGEEMSLFFNEEDVLKPGKVSGKGGSGIRRFCITTDKDTTHKSTVNEIKKKRVRKSEVLPVFEISGEEGSDDDLPNYNINGSEAAYSKPDKINSHLNSVIHKGRKSKHKLLPKSLPTLKEASCEVESTIKQTKKDKKRSLSGDRSVVQLIADNDSRDFTDLENDNSDIVHTTENKTSHDVQDKSTEQHQITSDQSDDQQEMDICYSPLDTSNEVDDDHRPDVSFSHLFPKLSNHHESVSTRETSDSSYLYQIPSPPPVEQVGQIVAELGHCEELPPLDILQLVDEWEKEKRHNLYLNGEKTNHVFLGNEHFDLHGEEGVHPCKKQSPVMSKTSIKISEPFQDIHIHKGQLSPPRLPTKVVTVQETCNVESCSENNSNQKFNSAVRVNDLSAEICGKAVVHTDKEDGETDDSDGFIDTQANFCLAAFEPENDGQIKQDSENINDVEKPQSHDTDKGREKESLSESSDDFFDTQANFALRNEDFFNDIEMEENDFETITITAASSVSVDKFTESVRQEKQEDKQYNTTNHKSSPILENTDNKTEERVDKKGKTNTPSVKTPMCKLANVSNSLFDDSYDTEVLNALKTQQDLDPSSSQFTFTQALACVHDSNELLSDNNSEKHLNIDSKEDKQEAEGCNAKRKNYAEKSCQEKLCNKMPSHSNGDESVDECSSDSLELPHFDLGFDIDDDIIPPTPNASQSFSQKSFSSCLSQSLLSSRKSLSSKFDLISKPFSDNKTSLSMIAEDSNQSSEHFTVKVTDSRNTVMETNQCNLIEDCTSKDSKSTTHAESFTQSTVVSNVNRSHVLTETESYSSVNVNCIKLRSGSDESADFPIHKSVCTNENSCAKESKHGVNRENVEVSSSSFVEKPNSRVSGMDSLRASENHNSKRNVHTPAHFMSNSQVFIEAGENKRLSVGLNNSLQTNFLSESDEEILGRETEKVQIMSPSVHTNLLSPESDDEVIGWKKKRVQIIESPSPSYTQSRQQSEEYNLNTPFKTPNRVQSGWKRSHVSNLSKEENRKGARKLNVSFKLPQELDGDDDDFAVETSVLSKNRSKDVLGGKLSVCQTKTVKRSKSKSPADMFIDVEAQVSDEDDEISDDEADGSDLDHMEDSFIGDATQMSQGQQEDMHAFYLKSIHSPLVRGKFKLKYDHDVVDVYSQPPNHEESQYMQDSFCVGDEFEETEIDYEEEVDKVEVESPDVTYIGRRTRWSKPIAVKKKKSAKDIRGRKRIRKISDDSSSEEESVKFNETVIKTPKLLPGVKRGRVVISSSTSDEDIQSKGAVVSPPGGTLNSQDIIPSLMTRIKKNAANTSIISELWSAPSTTTVRKYDKSRENITSHSAPSNRNDMANVSGNEILTSDQLRAQRLQKQKEKQEEFRKKMAEKKVEKNAKGDLTSVICDVNNSGLTDNSLGKPNCDISKTISGSEEFLLTTNTSSVRNAKKSVIFVDSREINGCQSIVSELRFKHNLSVIAAQLAGCDYVVSNRMGVDRKLWAEFTNGSNRTKLVDRIQHMCELYDRPCLIIEMDAIKGMDKGGNRPLHWTKYVDKTIVHLLLSQVKMYFTSGQIDTASVLADLCQLETRKNMAVNVPVEISDKKQQQVKFYTSLPKITYVNALNLSHNFKTIKEFLTCSVAAIKTKGCMSEERAKEVYNYVRRKFDIQLLPTSYGS